MRAVRNWLIWWVALFWLWFALQGEWDRIEWVAAACMATVAATLATALTVRGLLRYRVPWPAVAAAKRTPLQIVIDFGIVTVVLVRRLTGRGVRGGYVVREFTPTGRGALREGDVAWRTLTAMLSPNALPIDVDPERRTSLFHDLVPNRNSEEPA